MYYRISYPMAVITLAIFLVVLVNAVVHQTPWTLNAMCAQVGWVGWTDSGFIDGDTITANAPIYQWPTRHDTMVYVNDKGQIRLTVYDKPLTMARALGIRQPRFRTFPAELSQQRFDN